MLVRNASPQYGRRIEQILEQLPPFIRYAARLNDLIITMAPAAERENAQYQHGTRNIYIVPGVNRILLKRALFHEVAHAIDDNFGVGHYYGESPHWVFISNALVGDRRSSVETFADHMTEHLLDPVVHRRSAPVVAQFMDQVLDHLKTHFS